MRLCRGSISGFDESGLGLGSGRYRSGLLSIHVLVEALEGLLLGGGWRCSVGELLPLLASEIISNKKLARGIHVRLRVRCLFGEIMFLMVYLL